MTHVYILLLTHVKSYGRSLSRIAPPLHVHKKISMHSYKAQSLKYHNFSDFHHSKSIGKVKNDWKFNINIPKRKKNNIKRIKIPCLVSVNSSSVPIFSFSFLYFLTTVSGYISHFYFYFYFFHDNIYVSLFLLSLRLYLLFLFFLFFLQCINSFFIFPVFLL